jgi:chromosomal replication initiation ATPase DnaA
MRKLVGCSTVEIGKFFNRDHSTIMTSIDKIENLAETDPTVAREIQEFIDIVKLKA